MGGNDQYDSQTDERRLQHGLLLWHEERGQTDGSPVADGQCGDQDAVERALDGQVAEGQQIVAQHGVADDDREEKKHEFARDGLIYWEIQPIPENQEQQRGKKAQDNGGADDAAALKIRRREMDG